MTWRLYLHLDEHAQAAYFETLGGNNIADRQERVRERERAREGTNANNKGMLSINLSCCSLPPCCGMCNCSSIKVPVFVTVWSPRVCLRAGVCSWRSLVTTLNHVNSTANFTQVGQKESRRKT